jgi:hypothetical protein
VHAYPSFYPPYNSRHDVNFTNTAIKFLIVGSKAESWQMFGAGSDVLESLTLSVAELPTRWIDYSAVDVVALSPSDLRQLAKTRPEALTALRRWVRRGGQMWVHPAGEQWEHLVV